MAVLARLLSLPMDVLSTVEMEGLQQAKRRGYLRRRGMERSAPLTTPGLG